MTASTFKKPHGRWKHGDAYVGKVATEWRIWRGMQSRCYNANVPEYHYYGGRGITVCERWRGECGYQNFLADMGRKPAGYTLDRIDNDGSYEPSNCRWATRKEQMQNTRHNVNLTLDGETCCLSEWARRTGIKMGTLWFRFKKGWSAEKILTTRLHPNFAMLTIDGVEKPIYEWAKQMGLDTKTVSARLYRGWTPIKAATAPLRHY